MSNKWSTILVVILFTLGLFMLVFEIFGPVVPVNDDPRAHIPLCPTKPSEETCEAYRARIYATQTAQAAPWWNFDP